MKILLAVDDDRVSHQAARVVADWFPDDASVVVLHVGPVNPVPRTTAAPVALGGMAYPIHTIPGLRSHSADILREAYETAAEAAEATDGTVRVERGDPGAKILDVASEIEADLVVVGTDDRSWLSRLLDRSVSNTVAQRADCSVLIVRPSDGEGGDTDR